MLRPLVFKWVSIHFPPTTNMDSRRPPVSTNSSQNRNCCLFPFSFKKLISSPWKQSYKVQGNYDTFWFIYFISDYVYMILFPNSKCYFALSLYLSSQSLYMSFYSSHFQYISFHLYWKFKNWQFLVRLTPFILVSSPKPPNWLKS